MTSPRPSCCARAACGLCLLSVLAAAEAKAETVTPPEVIENPAATYPEGQTTGANVVLLVTIDETGAVHAAEVAESGGAPFDRAADEAVHKWRFKPARHDGQPIAVRIRIAFEFKPPPTPEVAAPPAESHPPPVMESTVQSARLGRRGASDIQIEVGKLEILTNRSPDKILQLAPGIFLANEGGAGHADQVFLRGFNAEQGQQIEFTVNGVPLNQVNNPDGHGYADTHFLIPELVRNLRVVEGPFDPHQGDFAVAGSADYELGVQRRGLHAKYERGSFDTWRMLSWWAPNDTRPGTFAAAQFSSSAGYGVNRASTSASAIGQFEGALGDRGSWRLLGMAYGTHYKSAGIIRLDDIASGRLDFYGTEDPSQGGDAQRFSLSFDARVPVAPGTLHQQLFVLYNTARLLENTTSFLLDDQEAGESLHPQRGDGLLMNYSAVTAGARGGWRLTGPFLGHEQAIEAGYYARVDRTSPQIDRVRFGTTIPYKVEQSLETTIVNVAGFLDAELRPLSWLTLRGGVRQELFHYDVTDLCATNGIYSRNQPLDVPCPSYDRSGPRLPSERVTATGVVTEPKATALIYLPGDLTLTTSFGIGAQSRDAQYISQDENAPVTVLKAAEAGALYHRHGEGFELTARAVGYYTHVDRDLIYDPSLGRLSAATGTTRTGFVATGRFTGQWIDELASVTYARATFDEDGALVPYVPAWVARSDTAVFAPLPWRPWEHALQGTAGLGLGFVGARALPFSQAAPPTFVMDVVGSLRWRWLELGVRCDNLLDARYALSQFFYASDFRSRAYPTLTPAHAITAAPPRSFLFTFALHLDQEADR